MFKIYAAVCALVSLIAFALYGVDKYRSKREARRIPELSLLTVAALGGGVGALAAMLAFRHKTNFGRKAHFVLGVSACALLQIVCAWALLCGKDLGL